MNRTGRLFFSIFIVSLFFPCVFFAEETLFDDEPVEINETSLVSNNEDETGFEDFDSDFDAIFENVEDKNITVASEEKKSPEIFKFNPIPITFTGNLTIDSGIGYIYESTADLDEYVRRFNQYKYYDDCYKNKKITYEEFKFLLSYHNITNNPEKLFTDSELVDFTGRKLVSSSNANEFTGYFTFSNKIYMNARPSKDVAIHGTMDIAFPGYSWALSEFYFDLIIMNRLYFTVGKKATTWGYTRLFSQSTNSTKEYEVGGENTNILYDSGNGTTVMLRLPLWSGTLTGLAVYTGSSSTPSFSDMYFAGSVEMVVKKVSINAFMRKETSDTGSTLGPMLGLELKRTILGADVYGQVLGRCDSDSKFEDLFKGSVHRTNFQQFVYTAGMYKWWDKHDPHVGFNVEYQGTYSIYKKLNPDYGNVSGAEQYLDEIEDEEFVNRIAYDVGIKRLGRKQNIKIGIEGSHNLNQKEGYVKPGFKISGIFPYCDWTNGVKWEYHEYLPKTGRLTFGSYLTISITY